jgi:hypothetical protein
MMSPFTRLFLFVALLAAGAAPICSVAGLTRSAPNRVHEEPYTVRIDRSLEKAGHYLLAQQGDHGDWRSDVYGSFKDGDALTPLVLHALLAVKPTPMLPEQCHRGAEHLAGLIHSGSPGLTYPAYTASLSVVVLSRADFPHHRAARDAWLEYLCARQMTERLGWRRCDPQFGGWGYAKDLPFCPEPGRAVPALHEPNLSATVFALEASRAAGRRPTDAALQDAKVFVQRCQNFSDGQSDAKPPFDDGGFFFIHNDATRNKAGVAGMDKSGRTRYVSYGSTTADGVRALLLCGLDCNDPRVVAAKNWLTAHFDSDHHPGAYPAARRGSRPALDYYYCASLAQAFHELVVRQALPAGRTAQWAPTLAEGLLRRQGADGAWRNPSVDVREDDPLIATSFAILALAMCREHLGDSR